MLGSVFHPEINSDYISYYLLKNRIIHHKVYGFGIRKHGIILAFKTRSPLYLVIEGQAIGIKTGSPNAQAYRGKHLIPILNKPDYDTKKLPPATTMI